jgi:chaperonin GroES
MSLKKQTSKKAVTKPSGDSVAETVAEKFPIPLGENILLSKFIPEEKTASGLFIPEMALKEEFVGRVVAVGPGVGLNILKQNSAARIPMAGDRVQYGEYAGIPIFYEGKDYFLMKESAVLCILP